MTSKDSSRKFWEISTSMLLGRAAGAEWLVLLFGLVYLRWLDFFEAEQEAVAAFEDGQYEPLLESQLQWRHWHHLPADELADFLHHRLIPRLAGHSAQSGNPLRAYVSRVADAIGHSWPRGFADKRATLGKWDGGGRQLETMVRWVGEQPFETPNDHRALLAILDDMLRDGRSSSRGFAEHHTPQTVLRLVAAISKPQQDESIYDPVLGHAGFVTSICDYLSKQKAKQDTETYIKSDLTVSGVDMNAQVFTIALTRLALAGISIPKLEVGNSLERELEPDTDLYKYDLIVADPPFGLRVEREVSQNFPIPSRDSSGLFVQHAISHLKQSGRAILVLPEGFFFKGGAERTLRRWLLEKYCVRGIVSLPVGAYLPRTSVKTNLIYLEKGGPTERVRMVDGAQFFEETSGRRLVIDDTSMAALVDAFFAPTPPAHAWDCDIETIVDADWDLTPRLRAPSELTRVLDELADQTTIAKLGDIARVRSGRGVPSRNLVDKRPHESSIAYIRIGDIKRGRVSRGSSWLDPDTAAALPPNRKLRGGDVLLSKSGTIGKVGIVQNGGIGAIAASGNLVIRPNKDLLDPTFLAGYLESRACKEWLLARATGSVISHLSIRVLADLPVPVPPLQVQRKIAEQYRRFSVDVFTYFTKLVSRGDEDPVADSINNWVASALHRIPLEKGKENSVDVNLASFEELAKDPIPVRKCDDCKSPYWLGVLEQHPEYEDAPYEYRAAYKDICLECWIDGREPATQPRFDGGGPLVAWSVTLDESLRNFAGLKSIPHGASLLNILQASASRINEAASLIKGHLPDEEKARQLTYALSRNLASTIDQLLKEVDIEILPELDRLVAGKKQKLAVNVINKGGFPLRDFELFMEPGNQEAARIDFLAEKSKVTVPLELETPEGDKIAVSLHWFAKNLGGGSIDGSTELAFEMSQTEIDVSKKRSLALGSPYVTGDPVRPDRDDVFFGREDLMAQVRRQILESGNVVLLEGNRRTGKTSILAHLEGDQAIPGWLCVYCSLQDAGGSDKATGVPTAEVFRLIARKLCRAVHKLGIDTPLPDGGVLPATSRARGIVDACKRGITNESAFGDLAEYVDVILEALEERGLGIVLMLDEFDKLQEGIDNGVTSPQTPENIRSLVQANPKFSAILTGSRRLKRLREEYWSALFGLGTRIGVSSLPREAAEKLIQEPVRGQITFTDDAVEYIGYLTAYQPFLIQCLCNRIYDLAARRHGDSTKPVVTMDQVDAASNELVQDNEHFASLWGYAGSERCRFILSLLGRHLTVLKVDVEAHLGVLSFGQISEILASVGIEASDEDLDRDLEHLCELELVSLINIQGSSYYRIAIPLMHAWIEPQKDIDALMRRAREETEDSYD